MVCGARKSAKPWLRGTMAAVRLAACVTLQPMQVTCAELDPLLEEVLGQVMVLPNECELHG